MTVLLPGFAEHSVFMQAVNDPEPYNVVFGTTAGVEGATAKDYAERIKSVWEGTIMAICSNHISVTKVRTRLGQQPGTPPIIMETTTAPVAGALATSPLPQNCAALVKKQTGFGGRQFTGRMYLPGVLPEGDVDQLGVINATRRGFIQDKVNLLLQVLDDDPPGPVMGLMLLHSNRRDPVTGEEIPNTAPVPTAITGLTVQTVIATQRRRLRK
jgi:hypothetical protein